MNKMIAGLFAIALATSGALADVGAPATYSKDLKKVVDDGPYVNTAKEGVTLSGYVDVGYSYNFNGRGTAGGSPASARFPQDRISRGDFNVNAAKIALEKALPDANELSAGFRIDAMFGEDAGNLGGVNAGNTSGFLLEQAYAQFRVPIGNGLDFKFGRFVTILGYEVIERPVNLNITYGLLFQNAIPLHHQGVLTYYKWNDYVETQFGVVNDSNSSNAVGVDGALDDGALLASINLMAPGGNANWYNSVMYTINGDAGLAVTGGDNEALVIYDTWGNWLPKFANDKLLLGVNFNLGQSSIINTSGDGTTTWFGSALYAKYQFTEVFSLASRAEYLHTDDGGRKFGNDVLGNEDLWSWTLTAGFDFVENMQLRTEYRLDWGEDVANDGNAVANNPGGQDGPAHMAALQIVYSF